MDFKKNYVIDTLKVDKQIKKLKAGKRVTETIQDIMAVLTSELSCGSQAISRNWPNFGKLSSLENRKLSSTETAYHCHLIKGNPTYVAVWIEEVHKNGRHEIKFIYVGTHESAPY